MPHSGLYSILSSLLALGAVLGLILLAAKLVRVSGFATKANARLALEASLMIDSRRRLMVVRADGRLFLLLAGGATDLVVAELWEPAR